LTSLAAGGAPEEVHTDPDERLTQAKKQLAKTVQWRRIALGYGLVVIALGLVLAAFGIPFWIAVTLEVIGAASVVAYFFLSPATLEQEIRDLAVIVEIIHAHDERNRALKMFRAHQFELRRYYNLARQHSRTMLIAGLICISLGVVIVIVAGYMVLNPCTFLTEAECEAFAAVAPGEKGVTDYMSQIIIGVLGAAGVILTDYVAAIYMKMYAVSSQSLNDFHNRLVSTHHLVLANDMVSRITDDTKREDAITEIVKELAKG
jgi:hypothetical protein